LEESTDLSHGRLRDFDGGGGDDDDDDDDDDDNTYFLLNPGEALKTGVLYVATMRHLCA